MAKARPRHGGWTKRNKIGFMYVCIWIFGFLVFQLYPFISSLLYSFTNYDIFHAPEFVGLDNYVKLFTKDREFWNSMAVTLKYTFITVPGKVVLALIIAVILNRNLKGINFIRTVYYIPSLLSGSVAVAILWKVLFMNDGFINSLLGLVHIGPVKWLGTPDMAVITICMLEIWQFGSSMVLFLSALTGQRVDRLFGLIDSVVNQAAMRIPTGVLNQVLADAQARVQPPTDKGKRLKIYYMTQIGVKPPHFVIFCNDAQLFHFSYRRYLENQIRATFGLTGTPVRITIRQKGDKEDV